MAKITGIGGVFIKSAGKGSELAAWYKTNLGLELESWGGAILKWTDDEVKDGGLTVWSSADSDTKWFSPSESSFMINYRVDNMDEMLAQLKRTASRSLADRIRPRTASLHGSWTPTATSSSCGSQWPGTKRTRVPELPGLAKWKRQPFLNLFDS